MSQTLIFLLICLGIIFIIFIIYVFFIDKITPDIIISNDKLYKFEPKEDISSYEVAKLLKLHCNAHRYAVICTYGDHDINESMYNELTDDLKRHFQLVENNAVDLDIAISENLEKLVNECNNDRKIDHMGKLKE